jgi:dTDP-glucose 4,6-dehydratase
MNKTILVTGGCGFVGSHFILQQMKKYSDIRLINLDALTYAGNVDNIKEIAEDPRYVFVKGDVTDRALVEEIFRVYNPTFVVHFAGESDVDRSIEEPDIFVHTNILGTQVLLDVARKQWQKVGLMKTARFLYMSTDEVYGGMSLASEDVFEEDSPLYPSSPYSASKAAADVMTQAYHRTYNLPTLIIRSSNNYGTRQYPEKLIPITIKNALLNKPIPVHGDGFSVRNWLWVEDNCEVIDALLYKGTIGEIYNICGSREMSNLDIIQLILHLLAEQTGKPVKEYVKLITFVADRPGQDRKYSISNRKICLELGLVEDPAFDKLSVSEGVSIILKDILK